MKIDLRKVLLAGTAIVAVGAFAATEAQALPRVMAGAGGTWAGSGVPNAATAAIADAVTGDAVDITTGAATLTITNNNVATDGGGVLVFNLGAITDSGAGVGTVAVAAGASAGIQAVTIASVAVDGAFGVAYADGTISTGQTVAITGGLTTGTTFSLVNSESTLAETQVMTVGGALTVGTTAVLTGGTLAGGGTTTALTVTGNSAFTAGMTVTGGANHVGNTATLTLNGATNTGAIVVNNNTGLGQLTFSGAVAQTVAGAISGTGNTTVNNASGVVFAGTVATATTIIEGTAANSSATFQAAVTSAVTLGTDTNAGDVNTVTFDGSTAGFATNGAIGGTAGETNNIVVSGGNTINQATGAWGGGGNINNLNVTGTGTILDSDAAIAATTTTIGTGATLDVGAGALTSAVTMSGTLLLSGGGGVVGTVTGASGTLDVDATSTVTGAIAGLDAIDIATGVVLTTGGATVGATTVTLAGVASEIEIANGATLTGNVVGTVAGEGIVTILDGAGPAAIVGNLGTSATATIDTLMFDGGTGQTVTTTGHLFVDTTTLTDATDVLQFIGTSAQSASGAIDGPGILTVGDGVTAGTDVTFSGLVGGGAAMASGTVDLLATARFDANAIFTGAWTNTGRTEIGAGAVLTAGTLLANTGTVSVDVGDAGATSGTLEADDIGTIVSGGGVVNLSTSTVNFNVTGSVATGTLLNWATSSAAGVAGATVTDNSFLYGFTLNDVAGGYDLVVAQANTLASASTTSGNLNTATVLQALEAVPTTDADLLALIANMNGASDVAAFNEVVEAAQPTVDGGAAVAALDVVNSSFSIMGDRLASLRTGDSVTGMTTGNVSSGARAWIQGFGATAEQDKRDNIDGYDADTYGVAVGMDSENVFENTVMGVSFSYANTDVDSDNANTTNTEVDSYQFSVYGDHDFDNDIYMNGMVAYTFNENDTTRHNVGGVVGSTARGDFDANQFTIRTEVGRDYAYDTATLTPHVLGHWTHYDADSYTETGAGGASLVVDNDDMDVFELGIGVDASWLFQNADGSHFSPEVSVGYRYDLAGDEVETTSTFTGGGAAFKSEGFDAQQSTFDVGAGFTYYSTDNWELTAEYDYTHKEDFDSHAGLFRAGYRF